MIDFHTHILPRIDDGSGSPEMSEQMILRLKEQDVTDIILTSHFYRSRNDIELFLKRRDESLGELMKRLDGKKLDIKLHLGAEVLYFDYIDKMEGLEKLAIGNTRYLLLEMPFSVWSERELNTVYKIMCRDFTPIIAHFERYIPIQGGMKEIHELKHLGCILQMNAENFDSFFPRRRALKFFGEGTARLLGTDCHNTDKRPPEIKKAYDTIATKLGKEVTDKMDNLGHLILEKSEFIQI